MFRVREIEVQALGRLDGDIDLSIVLLNTGFALTIYPIFTYFTCCQVEIHGPTRSSDALRVTFAYKREYFLQKRGKRTR